MAGSFDGQSALGKVVSVVHVSNSLGTVNDVARIVQMWTELLATFRDRPGVAEAMTAAQEQIRSASATVPQAAAKVLEAGFGAEAPAIQ